MSIVTESKCVIYGLHCLCHDGAEIRYVGQTTVGAKARLATHIQGSRSALAYPVYNWIRKHGEGNIATRVILDMGSDGSLLNSEELRLIAEYRLASPGRLLNIRNGGSNSPLAEESKKKIGDKARGRRPSAAVRAKMSASHVKYLENHPHPALGWKMTDAQLSAHSARNTGEGNGFFGKTHSAETLARIAANRPDMSGENNPFFGKTHSSEVMEKIRLANIGRVQSESERRSKSIASTGERNNAATLTEVKVREIYRLYSQDSLTQVQIGHVFGIEQGTVSSIVRGATWKHLGLTPIHGRGGRTKSASDASH